MKYFQQGGSMTAEQQQALVQALTAAAKGDIQTVTQVLGIQSEDQLKQFVELTQKMSQQKQNPKLAKLAQQALVGLQKALTKKAAQGAKLNYIKILRNKCPEGYEMSYYKVGGKICHKCQKVQQVKCGKKLEDGGESSIVKEFKNKRKNG